MVAQHFAVVRRDADDRASIIAELLHGVNVPTEPAVEILNLRSVEATSDDVVFDAVRSGVIVDGWLERACRR